MKLERNKDLVDVERELRHWAAEFKLGKLPAINFRHEVDPVIRLACEIYVRDPHGTRSTWLEDLQVRLSKRPSLRGNIGSDQIASGCWDLLSAPTNATSQIIRIARISKGRAVPT